MDTHVSYALCDYAACFKRKTCLRFINKDTKQKAICDFKPICNQKSKYKYYYPEINKIEGAKNNEKTRK
jgi:hypothetical protein